ncbi:ABC transporter substrate-binding protein [Ancylobacter sp. MQZ15Z-1]|uniref:ABC transporter substrate-binding protein n=1 Tax=Ancylobacter mangrovi TaxID=2972472 RepID=A0A9X2T5M3_9HYPH|nr:ABC transporter substrate-binding protein [Ancylobacter mangrovi]MCS0494033.1 ABC transporter substrate-binding protein [Ancylobacter mangrovi]
MTDRTDQKNHSAGSGILPGVSRRTFLAGAAALTAAGVARPGIVRAADATMTVPNSGGALEAAYKAAYFDTFTEKTGVKILGAPYMDTARIKAMVDANAVDIDVANIDFAEAAVLAKLGLLEPIDYDIVDRKALLPWAADDHYIVSDVAGTVMGWNTQAFTEETRPKGWVEFFDASAKPGQRSLWKLAPQTMEIAALGAGVSPDKLYPLDLDAVFSSLDKIKPNLTWWTSGAQSAQLLISNEVDVGTSWNGRLYKPKVDGAPIDYTFDQCIFTCDAFIVPKGVKDKKRAMEFLANLIEAKNQAVFAQHIPYGPTNPKAFDMLDAKTKALLPNSPENGKTAVLQNVPYWAEHGDELFAKFNKWLVG